MSNQLDPIQSCPVTSTEQIPLNTAATPLVVTPVTTPTIKVPVVLAEPTLQIVVEADIPLAPAATEIKRVKKNVFLNQVKLVPVAFLRIAGTDFFRVTRAKLFVAGHIRKNIEYASAACNGALQDRIADVPFSGFTDLTFPQIVGGAFPILGISEFAEANFLNETTQMDARLDKAFFQNLVKYNEQPFGELVAANFFELDFSPVMTDPEGTFDTLREKIVLDLTVKVLQVQQVRLGAGTSVITPNLTGLTPPVGPTVDPPVIHPTEPC
ncbi:MULTISPECIES: CsxC family protein [unclassified Lysinibacillus]|uniref:CsxC family protein n=1 Tax=unclassified Lysinibacillus TaxID=2636778 RepID=UPI0020123C23|nr:MULTISPECIES: Uracil permease [unclassified Lysinibacillus]MCL1694876.1 Uracil permease [Lysinibacillus sp. BPa_S21]MCL1701453.1 Uracil permease [Lysinibacillus sp. Bpr_S20]